MHIFTIFQALKLLIPATGFCIIVSPKRPGPCDNVSPRPCPVAGKPRPDHSLM
jgi:hypothetical protein